MWPALTGIVSAKYSPLMGHVDQFSSDSDTIILLETTGTHALRDLVQAIHISWILMVAPSIARGTFSLSLTTLEVLYKALAIIIEHNSHLKTNW